MPTEPEYTLQELATIAGVTPRTVRYYISVGLLPSPGQVGPGTRYGDAVLQRVRLIRRLQDQHLPLAEIRGRIEGMDDSDISAALHSGHAVADDSSALDYIHALTGRAASPMPWRSCLPPPQAHPSPARRQTRLAPLARPGSASHSRRTSSSTSADHSVDSTTSGSSDSSPSPAR